MANELTASFLEDLSQIAIAETQLSFSNLCDLREIITVREAGPGSSSVRFPRFDSNQAARVSDGSSMTNNEITKDPAIINIDGFIGCQHSLTDLATYASAEQGIVSLSQLAAREIVTKINREIIALYASFNGGGSSNVDISEDAILEGVKTLLDQGVINPYLVVSPTVFGDIQKLYAANTNLVSSAVRDQAYRGIQQNGRTGLNLFGCEVIVCNNYVSDANGDVTVGMFAPSAIGAAVTIEGLKVEIERDASLRGYKIAWTLPIRFGIINVEHGYKILVDN
jgi:hypothetical protein